MTKIWAILTAAFALAVLFVLSAHYLGGSGDITSEPNDAGLPGELSGGSGRYEISGVILAA